MDRTALFSRRQPGGVFVVDDLEQHPGDVFFVDSGHTATSNSVGYGKNPDRPFATLDYAISNCTASNGDMIYVMPGHAENLAADSAVDVDVAGITIIGLGKGAARPTFTATATAGDFKLAAASTHIENLLFLGGIDATSGIIEVSGADCVIKNCEYRDSTGQATDVVMVVASADRCTIDGLVVNGASAAGGNSAIAVNAADDLEIKNCRIYGNFAVGAIDFRTAASARAFIHDCTIWTENAADIGIVDTITGSTGIIGPNLFLNLQDDAGNVTEAVTGATFNLFDPVYVCNAGDQKALLINWTPVADS